jgi:nicotinamide mononucleotide adenylyltransferase
MLKNKLTKNKKSGIWFHKDRDEYLNLIFNDFKSEEYKNDSNYVRVLSYTNKTTNILNKMIRREIFGKKDLPEFIEGDNLVVGQPVVDEDHEIIYTIGERLKVISAVLATDDKYGMKYWILHVKNYDISPYRIERELKIIHKEYTKQYLLILKELAMEAKKKLEETNMRKKNAWKQYFKFKHQFSWVKYSYAITVHCSQGSTFQNVYVIESDCNKLKWNNIERNKLKYVAFTRASHLLRII